LPDGIILKGIGGFYYIMTDKGLFECRARGLFRKEKQTPLPGDKVKISITDEKGQKGYLEELLPRKNQIDRPAVANADKVIIVTSAASPEPDLLLIDKLLIALELKNIDAYIYINKVDLAANNSYLTYVEEYRNAGYNILAGSTLEGNIPEELESLFREGITVLAGQSGVGKSTILNNIFSHSIMQTGEVSEKIGRGKHTTRHAELILLKGGGYVVDTPGFSSFDVISINESDIQSSYREFKEYFERCKFKGCSHINEPVCGVKKAVEEGGISRSRYQRYIQLFNASKLNSSKKYSK
jgi:ribosome biogenesis GTPase